MIFLYLFITFFKIGLFTIGGGYAMIPMMQDEIVTNWQWIANDVFVNFIGIAESTPGPVAINMATFVGFHTAGVFGSACATIGVVLPSFIIILIIAKLFDKFANSKVVKNMFWGFRPVVAGLVLSAGITLGLSAILPLVSLENFTFDFGGFDVWALAIFAVAFVVSRLKIKGKKTHPFTILIMCAVLGVIIYGVLPMMA